MAKYEAKATARMKVKLAPREAFAMAVRINRLVRAEVDRAMQVATVKGLNKKLVTWSAHDQSKCNTVCTQQQWPRCSIAGLFAGKQSVVSPMRSPCLQSVPMRLRSAGRRE